jgi:hypothetical protein
MVKVLVNNGGWAWSVKCRGCKSLLEVATSDVKYGTSGMDAGDPVYYIDCPVCRTQTFVPNERLTPFFLVEFQRRHRAKRR